MAKIEYLKKKTEAKHQKLDSLTLSQKASTRSSFAEKMQLEKFQKVAKKRLGRFIDSRPVIVFMTLITIYALYFDDIRILFFAKAYDDIFFGITLLGMICFTVEIVIASYAKEDYMFSFFFWLDIISTLSMIPDCGWIWEPLVDSGQSDGDGATDLAKTSRASKVTRVIRVLRLIRLIRIVKLYK